MKLISNVFHKGCEIILQSHNPCVNYNRGMIETQSQTAYKHPITLLRINVCRHGCGH